MYYVNESPHKGCLYVCVLRFSKIICVLFRSVHTLLPPSLLRFEISILLVISCPPPAPTNPSPTHTLCWARQARTHPIKTTRCLGKLQNLDSNEILHTPGLAVHPTVKKTHDFQLIRLKKHQIALKTLCLTLLGTLSERFGRVLRYSSLRSR